MKKHHLLPKALLLPAIICCVHTLAAFHIQVGLSGYSQRYKQYCWGTAELGGTPSYCKTRESGFGAFYDTYGVEYFIAKNTENSILSYFTFSDLYNTSAVTVGIGEGLSPSYTPKMGCPVYYEEIGYSYLPYIDKRLLDVVSTVRGNPYSLVVNGTKKDLTINGTLIPAGTSANLVFPIALAMEEVENVVFSDLDSGTVLSHSFENRNTGPLYIIGWTGNICITVTGEEDTSLAPTNFLPLYADIKSENQGKILYAGNGAPIHQSKITLEEVCLNTEWVFNQKEWDSPIAYINGAKMCGNHSTTHIISYKINTNTVTTDLSTGIGSFTFTMSQTASSGGGACVMRCWDEAYATYDEAPEAHRAAISAGTGVATFKYTLYADTGEWKVEPQ